MGRNTAEIWYDSAADADQNRQNTLSFTFDAAGQTLTASDSFAEYDYSYDPLGRITGFDFRSLLPSRQEKAFLLPFFELGWVCGLPAPRAELAHSPEARLKTVVQIDRAVRSARCSLWLPDAFPLELVPEHQDAAFSHPGLS